MFPQGHVPGPCHWQARQRSSSKGGGIAAVSCCQGNSCCAQHLKFLGRASSSVCTCLLSGYKANLLHRFVLSPSSAAEKVAAAEKVEKTPTNQLFLHHEVLVKGSLCQTELAARKHPQPCAQHNQQSCQVSSQLATSCKIKAVTGARLLFLYM